MKESFEYKIITCQRGDNERRQPCQPFSIGGRHDAHLDKRDMFPRFFQAVRELRPKAFLIENVRGLLRQNFSKIILFLDYINLK
jgi:DNA (cytosine-5)-methyltransferase 1